MTSMRNRIQAILESFIPSEIKFVVKKPSETTLVFSGVIDKKSSFIPIDNDLQFQELLLSKVVKESWDTHDNKYVISKEPAQVWSSIINLVAAEYSFVSTRSPATKRKTWQFIRSIRVDHPRLCDFIVKIFTLMNSNDYENKLRDEKAEIFEQFEPLRRTYGKRD